ncbi:MAG: hypothetical protein FWD40_12150 [Treponema sp.]|nr:hypothetical protein [Treponema sp.]
MSIFFISCDTEPMGTAEPEKIFRVIYNGNGNTEGTVPVDENLYAAGDTFSPKPGAYGADLKKDGMNFSCWIVDNVAHVERPFVDVGDGIYWVNMGSIITIGENNVELIARYIPTF